MKYCPSVEPKATPSTLIPKNELEEAVSSHDDGVLQDIKLNLLVSPSGLPPKDCPSAVLQSVDESIRVFHLLIEYLEDTALPYLFLTNIAEYVAPKVAWPGHGQW